MKNNPIQKRTTDASYNCVFLKFFSCFISNSNFFSVLLLIHLNQYFYLFQILYKSLSNSSITWTRLSFCLIISIKSFNQYESFVTWNINIFLHHFWTKSALARLIFDFCDSLMFLIPILSFLPVIVIEYDCVCRILITYTTVIIICIWCNIIYIIDVIFIWMIIIEFK